jgi:hypothetical protein
MRLEWQLSTQFDSLPRRFPSGHYPTGMKCHPLIAWQAEARITIDR